MVKKDKVIQVYEGLSGYEFSTREACLEADFCYILDNYGIYYNDDLGTNVIDTAEKLKHFVENNPEYIKDLMEN